MLAEKSFIERMLFFEIPQEKSMAEANCRRRKVKITFFLTLQRLVPLVSNYQFQGRFLILNVAD